MAWAFVGVSTVAEATATSLSLTMAPGVADGDLLVACIALRTTSTTSLSNTGWTLVAEQKTNNTLTNSTSAVASGCMFYQIRAGATDVSFALPAGISVAMGRIVAYRNVSPSSPKDTQTSFTTAINITAVSGAGLTTTQADDLIVAMAAGGQDGTWSAFNATDPGTSSGTGSSVTAAPASGIWQERADSLTASGADTSLAIFDAVKTTAGATGNLVVTASLGAGHVVIAGAFKPTTVVHTTLTAATGSFALAGQAATFALRRRITLDPAKTSSLIVLSNGNLTATRTLPGAPNAYGTSSSSASGGDFLYVEATANPNTDTSIGISNAAVGDSNADATDGKWLGGDPNSIGLWQATPYCNGAPLTPALASIPSIGDVIGVFVERSGAHANQVWFQNVTKNEWTPDPGGAGHSIASLGAGSLYFGFTLADDEQGTVNFDGPFSNPEDLGVFTKWDGTPITTVTVTHYTLTAVTGSVALTQLPANLVHRRVYSMAAVKGTFALAGTVTNLRRSYAMAAARGTFALTGVDATLRSTAAYKLTADKGTFTLTGIAATLREAQLLVADTQAFAVTGVNVTLRQVRKYQLPATSGAFVLTGFAAALSKAGAVVMLAARGTFTLTGSAAVMRSTRKLVATSGTFALTGVAVNLVRTTAAVDYTLAALTGRFMLLGNDAVLSVGRVPPVPQFEILQFGRPVYHMPGRW